MADVSEYVFHAYGGIDGAGGGLDETQMRGVLRELDYSGEHAGDSSALLNAYFDSEANGIMDLRRLHELMMDLVAADVWEAFAKFDTDGRGFLRAVPLHKALNKLGCAVDQTMATRLLHKYDLNDNSRLELLGFARLVADLAPNPVREAFRASDGDDCQGLTSTQLQSALRRLDHPVDLQRAKRLLQKYRTHRECKRIDLLEFAHLVSQLVPASIGAAYFTHKRAGSSAGLNVLQLRSALREVGTYIDESEASQLLGQYDLDGSGKLGLLGFASLAAQSLSKRWWRPRWWRLCWWRRMRMQA